MNFGWLTSSCLVVAYLAFTGKIMAMAGDAGPLDLYGRMNEIGLWQFWVLFILCLLIADFLF